MLSFLVYKTQLYPKKNETLPQMKSLVSGSVITLLLLVLRQVTESYVSCLDVLGH